MPIPAPSAPPPVPTSWWPDPGPVTVNIVYRVHTVHTLSPGPLAPALDPIGLDLISRQIFGWMLWLPQIASAGAGGGLIPGDSDPCYRASYTPLSPSLHRSPSPKVTHSNTLLQDITYMFAISDKLDRVDIWYNRTWNSSDYINPAYLICCVDVW